jgi:hypothetical protein
MAVQVNYPGIYVDEFTPGAPIQGVGTNTGAFVGVALSGPILQPTLIQSWDEFNNLFGGFITTVPASYLAPAVYGFFLNGGTSCYILRVSTGAQATQKLDSRGSADPSLIVTAIVEGPGGNVDSVQVVDSSRLGAMLTAAGAGSTTLTAHTAQSNIVSLDATRTILVLASNTGFAVGDRVLLHKGGTSATAVIKSTQGIDTLIFTGPVPGATNWNVGAPTARIDDLQPGQMTFRVDVPAGVVLSQALPAGAVISITLAGPPEIRNVASSGGDTITLAEGLTKTFSLAGPAFPQVASLEFDMVINDAGTGKSETFTELSMNSKHPGYWGTVVSSSIITIAPPPAPPAPTPADPRPKAAVYNLAGGVADDRALALNLILANPDKFLDMLKQEQDINLVAIPGITDSVVQQAILNHCRSIFSRFGILDGVRDKKPGFDDLKAQFAQVRDDKGFAALYFPWVLARNPLSGQNEYWPPSGHVMGVMAYTDQTRGVHKAPANAIMAGTIAVERKLTNEEQGPLNLLGIDIIRVFREPTQPTVWGARTTSTDTNWQYINIRRLFIYLEQSIEQGIRWAIFEPNNTHLWQQLKRSIGEFLTRVWKDGALYGVKAEDAFYVRIDEILNPPSTRALGQLYIEVGVQPSYPAEFIILRIGIWQGGSSVNES